MMKAKKKQKQGKLSAFFSAKEATTANTEKANDPPADDAAEGAAALPGGRSGLKVLAVRYGIGNSKHDGEGRSITVEYEKARCVLRARRCMYYVVGVFFFCRDALFVAFFCDRSRFNGN